MAWDTETTAPETATAYPDVHAFVADFLAPTYRRARGGDRVWCANWHLHAEAVERLTALWEAYEHLRGKPLGASTWWLQHADPTMRVLLDADGPFRYCTGGHRDQLGPLPVDG